MVSSVWLLLGRHTSTINRGFIRSSSSATEGVGLKKNIIMEDGIPCELGRSDEWKGDGCFIKRVAPSTECVDDAFSIHSLKHNESRILSLRITVYAL